MKQFRKELVEELASKGNRDAILEMARYETKIPSKKVNQIVSYLLKLAQNDDTDAMIILGGWYYCGTVVKQNYKEAIKWYEKAADKIDERGLCFLGYCYYYGRDIDIDYEKAYSCFSQSAFLGYSNGMFKLGDMYYFGKYVEENKEAAFFWYQEASYCTEDDYDRASAEFRLGKCYLHGHGTEPNLKYALEVLQSSEEIFFELVEKGDIFSKITLKQVRKEIDTARNMLYNLHGIE